MNKRGILSIIEASVAIVIIFIVILAVVVTKRTSTETDLSARITPILEEIAKNNSLRDDIVRGSSTINQTINLFLSSKIDDTTIGYNFTVCNVGEVCGLSSYPTNVNGNVYVSSRIISSSIYKAASKKISIFLWFKK